MKSYNYSKNRVFWRAIAISNIKNVLLYQENYDGLPAVLSCEYDNVYLLDHNNEAEQYLEFGVNILNDTSVDIDLVVLDLSSSLSPPNIDAILEKIGSTIDSTYQLIIIFNNSYFYKNLKNLIAILNSKTEYGLRRVKNILYKHNYDIKRVFCSKYEINSRLDPLPELSNYDVPEKGNKVVDSFIHSIKEKIKNTKIGMMAWPAFVIDARIISKNSDKKFEEYLADVLECRIEKVIAGNVENDVLIISDKNTNKELIVRKYNTPNGKKSCELNYSVLKLLKDDLNGLIPEAYLHDAEHKIYIETRLPGNMLIRFNEFSRSILSQEHAWFNYQLDMVKKSILEPGQLSQFLNDQLAITYTLNAEIDKALNTIVSELDRRLTGHVCSFTPIHGDYKVSNLLFNDEGKLTGLIDWDCYKESALPLYDQLTLVMFIIINDLNAGNTGHRAFSEHLWTLNMPDLYKDFLYQHMDVLGIKREHLKELMICFWLCNISWRYTERHYKIDNFIDNFIYKILLKFLDYLDEEPCLA